MINAGVFKPLGIVKAASAIFLGSVLARNAAGLIAGKDAGIG